MTTEILNPDEIVQAIRVCSDRIAEGVLVCSRAHRTFADAERAYDQAFARAYMAYTGAAHAKKYAAELATETERAARDTAEVAYRYAERQARALENELRAWQSVGASVRNLYSVAGVN